MDDTQRTLIEKAERAHRLSEEELASLLADDAAEEAMAAAADRVRRAFVGDEVHLRGLIEFSSYCRQNCMYCGLRRDNEKAQRYRLTPEEIVALAEKAKAAGYPTVVMQSGEDAWFTAERLAAIVREVKALGLTVTLSVGERTREEYRALREAGADRFLLRIETTDQALYERLDPGMSYENRVRCLADLKSLGYEVGTGCLVGLPGQSVASLARDVLFFQSIDADMVGIGPLVPNGDTPLGDVPAGDMRLVRRVAAAIRLLLPEANIPATTAMETLLPGARELMLRSGANVMMPNVTEGEARQKYALYPGKACVADTPAHCRACMEGRIQAMGRTVGQGAGGRRRAL
ncbi:MAG: [FeFe] hydrogenase H-cluster radical SAM maturase HydE [Selenomonadaceae bacterium]|nr:[FeFe] hydrogenase H-cluster radical SAM maturase HydE [Selenomonadaceae bacterium]